MKNISNLILGILIGALVVMSVGLYIEKLGSEVKHIEVGAISSVGATNSTAKEYTVTLAPSTASATTTSLLNTDSTDRLIASSVAACTGVGTSQTFLTGTGLSAFLVQMSTSTVASLGLQGNANYAANITISTSSPWAFTASTTDPAIGQVSRVWPSQTYLNILFNATNTAACTVGIRTVSL